MAGNATAKTQTVRGARKTVISFTAPNKAVFEGVLDEQGLVRADRNAVRQCRPRRHICSKPSSPSKDFGGVKFPTRIVQREGGYPVLDLAIADVATEYRGVDRGPGERETGAAIGASPMTAERLSDGVWNLHLEARDRAVLVELRDHLVVVEAHDSEAVSLLPPST